MIILIFMIFYSLFPSLPFLFPSLRAERSNPEFSLVFSGLLWANALAMTYYKKNLGNHINLIEIEVQTNGEVLLIRRPIQIHA